MDSGSQWVTGDRPTVKGSDWDSGWGQRVIECSQSKFKGHWMLTMEGSNRTSAMKRLDWMSQQ